MSGPIVLLGDEPGRRPAFLMAHALYQPGLPLGQCPPAAPGLWRRCADRLPGRRFFSSLKHGDQSSLALKVFDESLGGDASAASAPTLIYDSDPELQMTPEARLLHHEIDFGGRNWILEFRPRSDYGKSQALDLPSLIIFGGMLGNILLTLLIFHLSTHRERAEQYARKVTRELRQHRDHLHELVAERTARLDAALQRVQAANQAKSKFLANMSHCPSADRPKIERRNPPWRSALSIAASAFRTVSWKAFSTSLHRAARPEPAPVAADLACRSAGQS